MLNQILLIGKIKNIQKNIKISSKEFIKVSLVVQRNYKNFNGQFDCDLINLFFWKDILASHRQLLINNNFVAIKGRVENHNGKELLIGELITLVNENNILD